MNCSGLAEYDLVRRALEEHNVPPGRMEDCMDTWRDFPSPELWCIWWIAQLRLTHSRYARQRNHYAEIQRANVRNLARAFVVALTRCRNCEVA